MRATLKNARTRYTAQAMRFFAYLLSFASLVLPELALSQSVYTVPDHDIRNSYVPNTDTHFKMPTYTSLEQWEKRRELLRKQILVSAGLDPMPPRTPLNPRIFGRIERDGYTIEKVLLETLPGYYLGGNLYRPTKPGRHPGILKPHGHWRYGRLEQSARGELQTLCINFALQGYVVFAYDMVGWNDTTQTPHDFAGPREQLWGFGPLGLQLWNSIRALDFLTSLDDVDPQRIGVTGASGGGTQTFLLYAVDDRVSVAAPVNMVSAIMQGGSVCENAPGLRLGTFNVEIAAMMAPKPLLLVSATGDWTRNTPKEEFPAIRSIYALYGRPENVENVHIDAPHNYNRQSREAVYKFFAKHLLADAAAEKYVEKSVQVEMPQDLLALFARPRPENALDYDSLFARWQQMSIGQARACQNPSELEERLQWAIRADWPQEVVSRQGDGRRIFLGRRDKGDRVPALWFPGQGRPLLAVHPEGSSTAQELDVVQDAINSGRPVLLVDVFQTGVAIEPRDRSHRHFLTFNLSDDQARVQDILTAIRFLHGQTNQSIEVAGFGKAGIWSLFAAALVPVTLELYVDLSTFGGSDEDYLRNFFVPGIQRAGGLEAALRVLAWKGIPVKPPAPTSR